MSDNWTPSTEQVRSHYVFDQTDKWDAERGLAFDRWLAAHDAALLAAEPATTDRETLRQWLVNALLREFPEWADELHMVSDLANEWVKDLLASGVIVPANKIRADAWDECLKALTWAIENGDAESWVDSLNYVREHNPYRAAELRGAGS